MKHADPALAGNVDTKARSHATRPSISQMNSSARRLSPSRRFEHSALTSGFNGTRLGNPLKVAIVVLWVLSALGSLALDVVVDVFQGQGASFPLGPVLFTSIGLTVLAMLLSVLLGRWMWRGFSVVQPFQGGQTFGAMQVAGSCLSTFASLLKVVFVSGWFDYYSVDDYASRSATTRYGVFTILGFFTAVGQVFFITSLLFFAPSIESTRKISRKADDVSAGASDNTLSSTRTLRSAWKYVWSLILLCVVIGVDALCDDAERSVHSLRFVAFAASFIMCVALIQFAMIPRIAYGYKMAIPYVRAPRLCALQTSANALLVLALYGLLALYSTPEISRPSWHVGCRLMIIMALFMHAVVAHLVGVERSRTVSLAKGEETESTTVASSYGPWTSTLFALALAGLIFVSVLFPAASSSSSSSFSEEKEGATRQSLGTLQRLFTLVLIVLPPFTHLQGRLIFGRRYAVWNPFGGRTDYMFCQMVGWTCYAVGLFFGTLHLSETRHMNFLLLETTTLLLAQVAIHVSLNLFGYRRTFFNDGPSSSSAVAAATDTARTGENSPGLPMTSPTTASSPKSLSPSAAEGEMVRSLVSTVVNGEMLLSVVLALIALLLRVVADSAAYYVSTIKSDGSAAQHHMVVPTTFLVHASTLFAFLSVPAAQLSMRDRAPLGQLLLHPSTSYGTAGAVALSGGYMTLVTLAWALYGYFVVSLGCSLLSKDSSGNAATTQGHSLRGEGSGVYIFPQYTAHGLILTIPHTCVAISSFILTQSVALSKEKCERVTKAMTEVRALLQQLSSRGGKEEKDDDDDEAARVLATCERIETLVGGIVAGTMAGEGTDTDTDARTTTPSSTQDYARTLMLNPDTAALVYGAYYSTVVMCLATAIIFGSAIFGAETQPALTLVFVAMGVLVISLSCFSIHYVYGNKLHSASGKYSFFMPFAGGTRFAVFQALGWICYTFCNCVAIACFVEGRGTTSMLVLMCVSGVAAQLLLLYCVPYFNPENGWEEGGSRCSASFLGRNAEGILSVLTLTGTFAFARAYEAASEKRTSSDVKSIAPMTICAISMCLAVPMGLVSLERQADIFGVSAWSMMWGKTDLEDDLDEDIYDMLERHGGSPMMNSSATAAVESNTSTPLQRSHNSTTAHSRQASMTMRSPFLGSALASSIASPLFRSNTDPFLEEKASLHHRRRRRGSASYALAVSYSVAAFVAFFVVSLLPFAVILLVYSYANRLSLSYSAAIRALEVLIGFFVALIMLPMLMTPISKRSTTMRNIHSAFCCFAIYSIPTYTVVGGVSPGFVFNTHGARLYSFNMCSMSLLSRLQYYRLFDYVLTVVAFGYFIQYHFYTCYFKGKDPFMLWECIGDISMAAFWLWYGRRFKGRPEVTGHLQSPMATEFFKKYFFKGMSYYFATRVIRTTPYTLPEETGRAMATLRVGERQSGDDGEAPRSGALEAPARVDLNDPNNQYFFSFHPHGVFPGSAIFVPKTVLWEKEIGSHPLRFVSTHCADVVFAVPLMRDFPLCLGAMSVSRKGIESSIAKGNSPLVVTGGQAEMLHTLMSDTEMHLVCHHLGFIRLAMRNRIPLVPVISFSESNIMDNVHCVSLQRWFLKRLGFPFIVLPHGRWHLPLPTSKPMTIIVGQPIVPFAGREDADDPECVEELRLRYFEHLTVLFYRYRAEAGYPNMVLYLHNGVSAPAIDATPLWVHEGGWEKAQEAAIAEAVEDGNGGEERVSPQRDSAVRRALESPSSSPAPEAPLQGKKEETEAEAKAKKIS